MKVQLRPLCILILGCLVASCDQSFEPNAPTSSRLVVYSLLNSTSSSQIVRLATTYDATPAPGVHNASVSLVGGGRTIVFRDTTIVDTSADGTIAPLDVYVATNASVNGGSSYRLEVSTQSGLTASGSATALTAPSFYLKNPLPLNYASTLQFMVSLTFGNITGAYVLHFYVEFNAYVNGKWELHRLEVPLRTYTNKDGELVNVYPAFALVQSLTQVQKSAIIEYDTLMYKQTRGQAIQSFPAAPVRWTQAVFTLTQIDNPLYTYYRLQNGPVDRTSVRMDELDFSNITNGLGVFGGYAMVVRTYPITR
jgi:hypothetical protein